MSIQERTNVNNEPFVLDDTAEVMDGVILVASQGDLSAGFAVLGEITASPGNYNLVDPAATDGSQIPKLILASKDIVNVAAPQTDLQGYTRGLFDENQLIFGGAGDLDSRVVLSTDDSIDSTLRDLMRDIGLRLAPGTNLTNYENA